MGTWSTIWWTTLACSGGAGAAGAALWARACWIGRRSGSTKRHFCPGPPPHPLGRLLPHRWFLRGGCGYPLAGLPATPFGTRCPECGRRSHPREWIPAFKGGRQGARWDVRWGRIAAVLLAAWIGALCLPAVRRGRWPAYAPTWSLAAAQWAWPRITGRPLPWRVEQTLHERIYRGDVSGWSARVLASEFQRDLKADGVDLNATQAAILLAFLGLEGEAALRASLRSSDYQERQMAAQQLWTMHRWGKSGWPRRITVCDDLLRVTVEGLGDDHGRLGRLVLNASGGSEFLAEHAAQARDLLEEGLESDDLQRRMLCALALGWARLSLERVVPVLVESLRDNGHANDARLAMEALTGYGPEVRGLVAAALQESAARGGFDRQQAEFGRRVLRALDAQAARELADAAPADPLPSLLSRPPRPRDPPRFWPPIDTR